MPTPFIQVVFARERKADEANSLYTFARDSFALEVVSYSLATMSEVTRPDSFAVSLLSTFSARKVFHSS